MFVIREMAGRLGMVDALSPRDPVRLTEPTENSQIIILSPPAHLGNVGSKFDRRARVAGCFTAAASRLLKNYLRGLCGVKNGLKMLIYSSKLRFFGHFCLA